MRESEIKMKRLIIYDLPEELSAAKEEDILFSASPVVKSCMGCFSCWVKTPGRCVINDRASVIPKYLSECGELIYISPVVYGGYSEKVKAAIERSIPYILPYFRIVDVEMHHQIRYNNPFKLTALFYGECDAEEKQLAKNLVKANAINLGAANSEAKFYDTAEAVINELRG